ncbi:HEAT repeat domain-containing protein [Candidatus Atribacteria bacterium 1244-E10-H5-B2]|nr:MAG: HEAT repeat domain-containing protein [Candidatus Atribacteria bacterium 1244-E10-H5-B2]
MKKLFLVLLITAAVCVGCENTPKKKPVGKKPIETEKDKPKEKPAETTKPSNPKIAELIKKLGSDKYKTREQATKELDKMILNSKEWNNIIVQLKKALKEAKDPEIEFTLRYILKPYVKWGLTPVLLKKFPDIAGKLESKDFKVRRQIVIELGKSKRKDAIKPLIKLLEDKDKDIRRFAAEALGKISDKSVVELLIEALKDKESYVRYHAAKVLGKIGGKCAVEPLIAALKDENVFYSAAKALGKIGDKRAIGPLRKLWKEDRRKPIQFIAACALAKMGNDDAFEFLIKALKDKDKHTRMFVVLELGDIGDKRIVEPLIETLKDKDGDVRLDAAKALKKITAKDFEFDYKKWKSWYDKQKK